MQLPIQYWKSTLTRLGVRVERRPAPQRSSASRFSVEMLERRQVMAADVIVDDSQIGFQITSLDWSLGSSGYLNESHIHTGGTGAAGAKWHVEGLTAGGQYQVFTTWAPDVGNATNTPLSITNGTTTLGTVRVNQTIAPNDVESLGTAWKSLGVFETSSGVLDIQITNDADGTVVADAVRLVEIRPTITGLTASPNPVALGSQVTLTATGVSDPGGNAIAEVRFYRDVNGDGVLTAADGSPVATDTSSSGGWSVSASTVSLPAGTNRFFAVAKDTTGVESDPVSVTATVLSPTRIIDDEDSGYSVLSGTWTESNTGYNNDHYYSYFNNGAVEWRFSNVVPGTYRVSATWLSASNRASAAPYEILDNTNSLATVLVNQKNAPAANVIAGGRNFQDLGNFEVVNGQLVVRLTNTTATTLCADAIRLEHIGPVQNVPEIRVYDGSAELYDAAATINFGSTFFGTAVQKTLTVKNVGVGNLSLTPLTQAAMPAGYTLVSGFGSTTLAQGQSTTFTVALSADSVAAASGTLSLVNNDSDEGSFDISLTGVVSAVTIKDDEDPGYAVLSGTWTESNTGYAGDHYFSYFNAGAVEWRFANLPSGTYRISATWTNASNRASAAPYEIIDGTNSLAVASVNQKNAPVADATAGGRNFQHLGAYEIVNGQLVVRLSNTAATTLSADAIRLEYLGPAQSVSEIRVYDGASELTDGTSIVGFGSTFFGTPIQKTLTVQNVGVASLTLTQLAQASMPAGYRLVSGLGATTLTQGQSTTFTVELTAKAPGTAAGTVSILNNDPDEGSFDIQVTGFVQASRVIDDQDPGFSIVSGTWQKSNTGYGNDHFFVYSGDFGVVQWQFANLPVGQYRVSAAWAEHPNRTTIAPYTILDGTSTLATVEVNQKLPAAADRTEGGRPFQDLGVFGVVNGTLVVKLADTTSLAVSADAIRIEYVGGPEVRYTSSGPSLVIDGTPATALDFGPSERANKTIKYLAVTNATASDLTLTQLQQQDMPTGYVLESGFSALSLAPGATSFFRVRLDAITPGTYGGAIAIQSGAGSFQLNITGQVIKTPVLVDDGDPEFQTTGTGWQSVAYGSGFKDDLRRATGPGGTNTARWTVDGLAPGTYMVYASYVPSSANTAAAPYKLYDGSTLEQQFSTNQRVAGNDVTVSGMGFGYVGQINVASGTLAVELNASGISDGWAIADAVYVVPVTGGYFHQFAAPSQMVTGSANFLTAGFVDPDGTIADSIHVYRDSNNNGVLDLATDQIWASQQSARVKLTFNMSTLPTGVHKLFVVAINNGQEVAIKTTIVTAAEWWRVQLGQSSPTHGEAGFETYGALTSDQTPIKLAKTDDPEWWTSAVWATVSGTVYTRNPEQDEPNIVEHQYDFPIPPFGRYSPSNAFDVGTALTLGKRHGGFTAPGGTPDQKLVVLEDLTKSTKPTNDQDYDDQYWIVTMQPVIPPSLRFELRFNDLGLSPDPSPNRDGIQLRPYREYGHWIDTNRDGIIEPLQEDIQLPAAFVRNTKGVVDVTVIPVPVSGAVLPDQLDLRGLASDGIDFPSTTAALGADGRYHFVIEASQAFRNTVWHYEDFAVHWETRIPGTDWSDLGTSHNHLYLTLSKGTDLDPLLHTLVHIGSEYGRGATTRDELIERVWTYFQRLEISRQSVTHFIGSRELEQVGAPFRYWSEYTKSGNLWLAESVNCGSITELFLGSLGIQGIDAGLNSLLLSSERGLVVNNWKATAPQILIDTSNYDVIVYAWIGDPDDMNGTELANPQKTGLNLSQASQLIDQDGTSGQNSRNPVSMFFNHTLAYVEVNGKSRWLDPSYGKEYEGDTDQSRLADFENRMLYGFGTGLDSILVVNLEVLMNRDLNNDDQITPDSAIDNAHMYHYTLVVRQDPLITELGIQSGVWSGW